MSFLHGIGLQMTALSKFEPSAFLNSFYSNWTTKQKVAAIVTIVAVGILAVLSAALLIFYRYQKSTSDVGKKEEIVHAWHKKIDIKKKITDPPKSTVESGDFPSVAQTKKPKAPRQPDTVLPAIVAMEKKIDAAIKEIDEENEALVAIEASLAGCDGDGSPASQKKKMADLEKGLDDDLQKYVKTFAEYLTKRFTAKKRDPSEVRERILNLDLFLGQCQKHEHFICEVLKAVDVFFAKIFFTSEEEAIIQEENKIDVIILHDFFHIINQHFGVIQKQDPELALRLKIKLANLPLTEGRESFANIYLTEEEQRKIMIDYFQLDEDQSIAKVIQEVEAGLFTDKDMKSLSKYLSDDRSRISSDNRNKLREALKVHGSPEKWGDAKELHKYLMKIFHGDPSMSHNEGFEQLYYASKAKHYFIEHTRIVRWWHATTRDKKEDKMAEIIKTGHIEVRHKRKYEGAWVSTGIEKTFGKNAFGFDGDIPSLDPDDVKIGHETKGVTKNKRWRGLQKPIPLVSPKGSGVKEGLPNLVLVGLEKTKDKGYIVKLLQDIGISHPKVVPIDVAVFIQKAVLLKLGNPNLSEKWWGKKDIKELYKPIKGHGST